MTTTAEARRFILIDSHTRFMWGEATAAYRGIQ